MYFTAKPPVYTDTLYNYSLSWDIWSEYGQLNQDEAYLAYMSTTPYLNCSLLDRVFTGIYNLVYQEDADEVYVTKGNAIDYLYVNYTKPDDVDGAIWEVRYGGYWINVTINNETYPDIWNAFSDKLMFRVRSEAAGGPIHEASQPYAWDGSTWIAVGPQYYSTGSASAYPDNGYEVRITDGDWYSGAKNTYGAGGYWLGHPPYGGGGSSIWEEAVHWGYIAPAIYFGNIPVVVESEMNYFEIINNGSPNDIIITGIILDSDFNDINNSYNYTLAANSTLRMYFSASPSAFEDELYDRSIYWILDESYGDIDQFVAHLVYNSTTPYLTYSLQNIDFGDIQVDTESEMKYLNLTNYGSPNDITITGFVETNPNFTHINNSFGFWSSVESSRMWYDIAMSDSGQYQSAVVWNGQIYTSDNYGLNWTARNSNRQWQSIAVSESGQYQVAGVNEGQVYVSNDYGVTWIARVPYGYLL